jgi:hypothetical protein
MSLVADFEDVVNRRPNQHGGEPKLAYRKPNGCEREGERHSCCKLAVGFGPLKKLETVRGMATETAAESKRLGLAC